LLGAAETVFQETGFEAATMAQIAARAGSHIGSLYHFFPNKDAVGDALMEHYLSVWQSQFDALALRAGALTPQALADVLIDFLVMLQDQTPAFAALLDARTDPTEIRMLFRAQAIAGVRGALAACVPRLEGPLADDIAIVVLNNMKTMASMAAEEAPTSAGAPQELRLMNRLYILAKLPAST
jgi:AcrR family transcriptional regulator